MSIVLLLVAVLVIGVLAAVVTGRLDASLPAAVPSSPHRPLPPGRLGAGDVEGVRFSLAVRGYRMDEVDGVLERLRAELAERDAHLQALTAPQVGAGPAVTATAHLVAPPHILPAPAPAPAPVPSPAPAPVFLEPSPLLTPQETTPAHGLTTGELAEVNRRHGRRARSTIDGA